jgi:peroxin-5
MEKGMQKFKEGNISEAIRNFEMELQLNDPDNATAWRLLGKCHAENDMDREAITCLEHAVDRDPYSPEALLALGVSYVNELNHAKALANLKQWITNNPKYAGMDLDIEDDVYGEGSAPASDSQSGFQEVQNLLLKALEFDSSDAADVWEALGVAANVSRDYETAVEAFHKAIQARSDDYQLYNKLGATLANSSQSDKALPAYFKALQLRPKYARAWLNMAISHSNLRDFDEAARCYLQTLSLNPAAAHCWSYLRVALSCSERWDLIPLAAAQDLNAFKEHFDFVLYD